jgi:copper chaperone CopZ
MTAEQFNELVKLVGGVAVVESHLAAGIVKLEDAIALEDEMISAARAVLVEAGQ